VENKKATGLGDTIAQITHFFKLDLLAEWIAKLRGKEDCGCSRRRDKLNKLVSYIHIPEDQYVFTESRKFRILEDITIPGDALDYITYTKDEIVFIDPSYGIYYNLRDLIANNKIKPEE